MRNGALLGWAVSAMLTACAADTSDEDASTTIGTDTPATTTVATTVATDTPSASDQLQYDEVLASVGVAVATAPSAAVVLGDAVFCGWDQVGPLRGGNNRVDLAGRRCFVEANLDGRPAMFLLDARTNEGDPTPVIFRTEEGRVTEFRDSTRDNYGTREWSIGPCDSLYVASYDNETPPRLWFSCVPWDDGGQP